MTFPAKYAAITAQANIMEYSRVMDALDSSNDQLDDREIMCAKQKAKENVLLIKHIEINADLVAYANA